MPKKKRKQSDIMDRQMDHRLYRESREIVTKKNGFFNAKSLYTYAEHLKDRRMTGSFFWGDPRRLDAIEEEIEARIRITKREIFTIGELLYEAREILKGEFMKWVEEKFDFSYYTANNILNVYVCCLGHRDKVEDVKASILYKISAPSFDEDLREFLFAQGGLNKFTNRDLKSIMQKYKKGGLDAIKSDFEHLAESVRAYEHTSYVLDNVEIAIRSLINIRIKIEKQTGYMQLTDDIEGVSEIGTQNTKAIWDAFEECIEILDNVKKVSLDKIRMIPREMLTEVLGGGSKKQAS